MSKILHWLVADWFCQAESGIYMNMQIKTILFVTEMSKILLHWLIADRFCQAENVSELVFGQGFMLNPTWELMMLRLEVPISPYSPLPTSLYQYTCKGVVPCAMKYNKCCNKINIALK